jgi:hypothetical protein
MVEYPVSHRAAMGSPTEKVEYVMGKVERKQVLPFSKVAFFKNCLFQKLPFSKIAFFKNCLFQFFFQKHSFIKPSSKKYSSKKHS